MSRKWEVGDMGCEGSRYRIFWDGCDTMRVGRRGSSEVLEGCMTWQEASPSAKPLGACRRASAPDAGGAGANANSRRSTIRRHSGQFRLLRLGELLRISSGRSRGDLGQRCVKLHGDHDQPRSSDPIRRVHSPRHPRPLGPRLVPSLHHLPPPPGSSAFQAVSAGP